MYFYRNEAYLERIPKCDGALSGPRRPLALPISSSDDSISEAIKSLSGSDPANASPTNQFFDDAETVGALLNKITNEPGQ
jgi:hypothetical protein